MAQNEEIFWRATLDRDATFDGQFVFAVRTTGIYCRPSCSARHPHRTHVLFFLDGETARKEGFRPCRRCKPEEQNAHTQLVERICRYIESNGEERVTLAALSAHSGLSPYHLQRIFKRITGITPKQYADQRRLRLVKSELQKGKDVTRALYEAGYGSSSRLYERASTHLGMTPATYRRGGRGMRIEYAITECALGRLLVGATKRGVCAVSLGDSDATLESALRKEYPNAEIHRDGKSLNRWIQELLRQIQGESRKLALPLDVQVTAFQRRVWEQLQTIPYGSTRSYSAIAKAIGKPKAVRAVARACATNPVALLIPCHRVVREDGSLGGYRWGLQRKRALLQQETKIHHKGTKSTKRF